MNRFALLAVGLLACVSSTGCYHCCAHKRGCVDWQGGYYSDPCCAAPMGKGARLQHHRPRIDSDEFCEGDDVCADCGRRLHRHGRYDDLCDDCDRGGRREARRAAREARRGGRHGRLCDRCGGVCTGECYADPCAMPCGGWCGDMGGYPAGVMGAPMIEGPMMGEGMMGPSGGGCSSCAAGGMTTSSYLGGQIYPGTIVSGPVMNGAPAGGNGWVSAQSGSYVPGEPLPAPAASGGAISPTGSSAPSPGVFPTPAR